MISIKKSMNKIKENGGIVGYLTIKKFKDGKEVWRSKRMKNRVVSSDGYGRNLVIRQLGGDATYPIEIDSAGIGTGSTAPVDGNTALETPTVTGVSIANKTITNDLLNVDIFMSDATLADGTYNEFALYCNARLFSRIIISPGYSKSAGEDTLFTYVITLNAT